MSPDQHVDRPRWPVLSVEELAVAIQYGYTAKANSEIPGPKYLRITDIQNDAVDWSNVPSCDIDKEEIPKYRLQPGDLVFARTGATVGKSFLIRPGAPESVFASYLIRIRFRSDVDPRYVGYFFRSPLYWRQISESQAGIGQPNVNGKKLAQVRLPVAPIEDQRRVVAEIEKQFSRLDEAAANLKRIKANLNRYKAAVLKAAVEDRLVDSVDHARLLDVHQSGAHDSRWQVKTSPDGWVWSTCGSVIDRIEAGSSFKCLERPPEIGEVGVLKVSAVTWGTFDEAETKTCTDRSRINEQLMVRQGDFLFSRANTIELVGACVIAGAVTKRLMLSDKILRLRLRDTVVAEWLLVCLRSTFGRSEIERLATGNQESMRNISQERIRQIRIPLPPLVAQRRIVSEVDRRLSIVREVEAEVDANLKRADGLRQAVLHTQFTPRG